MWGDPLSCSSAYPQMPRFLSIGVCVNVTMVENEPVCRMDIQRVRDIRRTFPSDASAPRPSLRLDRCTGVDRRRVPRSPGNCSLCTAQGSKKIRPTGNPRSKLGTATNRPILESTFVVKHRDPAAKVEWISFIRDISLERKSSDREQFEFHLAEKFF